MHNNTLYTVDHLNPLVEELTIPGRAATSSIFQKLGHLHHLRLLTLTGCGYNPPRQLCLSRARLTSFPALQVLHVQGSTSIFRNLLDVCFEVPSLRHLSLSMDSLESPSAIMWTSVGQAFPNLEALDVDIQHLHPDERTNRLKLRHLLVFGNITELRIRHPLPLEISDSDIRDPMDACPRLSVLSLNPNPIAFPCRFPGSFISANPTWLTMVYLTRRHLQLRDVSLFLGTPQAGHNLPAIFSNTTMKKMTLGSYPGLDCAYMEKLADIFTACEVKNIGY